MPRIKKQNFNLKAEAFEVISKLMDVIEELSPEIYYKSDLIARAEDLLVVIENESDFVDLEESGDICPNCGSTNFWRNSSGEMQCDNCGFEETAEE